MNSKATAGEGGVSAVPTTLEPSVYVSYRSVPRPRQAVRGAGCSSGSQERASSTPSTGTTNVSANVVQPIRTSGRRSVCGRPSRIWRASRGPST